MLGRVVWAVADAACDETSTLGGAWTAEGVDAVLGEVLDMGFPPTLSLPLGAVQADLVLPPADTVLPSKHETPPPLLARCRQRSYTWVGIHDADGTSV